MKPIYENEDIALYPFTEAWAKSKEYRSWFHDPDVTKYNSHGLFPYTDAQMESFLRSLNNGTQLVFVIIGKSKWAKERNTPESPIDWITSEGSYIGNVSLQHIDWVNRSAEFAIVIGDKRWWGKGVGKSTCNFMLYHGFQKMNLNRIWTGTASINWGMRNVADSCGFVREGDFLEAVWLDGVYVSVIEYAILKKNWAGGNSV